MGDGHTFVSTWPPIIERGPPKSSILPAEKRRRGQSLLMIVNVYTQVLDHSLQTAMNKIGGEGALPIIGARPTVEAFVFRDLQVKYVSVPNFIQNSSVKRRLPQDEKSRLELIRDRKDTGRPRLRARCEAKSSLNSCRFHRSSASLYNPPDLR